MSGEQVREAVGDNAELHDIITRQEKQLADWKIDTKTTPYSLGPELTIDPETETLVGADASQIALYKPDYRPEFAIPKIG